MLNEILFMQIRLVRLFCKKYGYTMNKCNDLFDDNNIFEYIESCYYILHTESDNNALTDIEYILKQKGTIA